MARLRRIDAGLPEVAWRTRRRGDIRPLFQNPARLLRIPTTFRYMGTDGIRDAARHSKRSIDLNADMLQYGKLMMEMKQTLFGGLDFESIPSNREFKEADVRATIIDPILKALGFTPEIILRE
jgi:hypothetical protein